MGIPIRVLIVEDSTDDTLLLLRHLYHSGYIAEHLRVENAEDLRHALQDPWDIVISDYTMPYFNAMEALRIVQNSGLDLPFIIVSGSIGEETAVLAMKTGAHDYIMKNNLTRLVPAIEREIREAQVRRQRTHALEELFKSEERYRRIVNTSQEGICLLDRNEVIVYANERISNLLGYAPEELIGSLLSRFIDPTLSVELSFQPSASLKERSDVPFLHKDGARLWAIITSNPIYNELHVLESTLVMLTDITRRKQAEDDLSAANERLELRVQQRTTELQDALEQLNIAYDREKEINELKSRFIALVSHEFRTPLTSILSSTDILARYRDRLDDEKIVRLLHMISESVQHMIALLEDVLLLGKAEAGKIHFEPVACNPQQLVQDMIELVQAGTGHNRTFNIKIKGAAREAMLDHKLLRHMILNLLSNAVKYSPEDSPVEVKIAFSEHTIRFTVADHGLGMSATDLEHLFEPFYRSDSVVNIPGTGLGMTIVRQSVKRHGGTLEVQSEIEKGTTFIIVLPG